jgi:monoterpene epsilon-lactone hydrolase
MGLWFGRTMGLRLVGAIFGVAALISTSPHQASAKSKFIPSTVSKAAEAILKTKPAVLLPKNKREWRKAWEASLAGADETRQRLLKSFPATIEEVTIAGGKHLLITPKSLDPGTKKRILVYTHGGAHTLYSPESSLAYTLRAGHITRARVLSVRYPLAWQKPHPASRDVVVAVYKELLKTTNSRHIAMFGDSAGGALVMSAVLHFRDLGLPMPAVLGLISPWADVTKTGDSVTRNGGGADPVIDYEANLAASAKAYGAKQNLRDPSISPIYADFTKGFPPSYISTGTRDLFLSHCARLQRKLTDAGVENRLMLHEGMWHVFQSFDLPEALPAYLDMAAFFEQHWAR